MMLSEEKRAYTGDKRQGRREEAEMEGLLVEIPPGAPVLFQEHHRRWCPEPERPWRWLDESSLVPPQPIERRGVYSSGITSNGHSDIWNAIGWERQEELGLRSQFGSLVIGKDKDGVMAPAMPIDPIDPYGIWSPKSSHMSSLVGTSLLPVNLLSGDDLWGELQHHPNSAFCRNSCKNLTENTDETAVIDELLRSKQRIIDSDEHSDVATPPISPQTVLPALPSEFSVLDHKTGSATSRYNLQHLGALGNPRNIDAFTWEDSLIIPEKELSCLPSNNVSELRRGRKGLRLGGKLHSRIAPLITVGYLGSPRMNSIPFAESLMDIRGFMSLLAKDQQGCRFLQRKFEEGTEQEREMVFLEIIDHVPELMVNPFGNYLMQKVLDMANEEQRMEIVLVLTKVPNELVRMSLNMHGTRAVQKLIQVLQSEEETALVISALRPGFLSLVIDPNGNHVIQRCMQYFSYKQNKFIFEAAARHCVDIATHRHGCCVLQRCIAYSTGHHQAIMVAAVSHNGLILAQDAYGNYAVQYVLDMRNKLVIENLKSKFKGKFVQLSMQKFSSNVVEKCLRVFDEAGCRMIISELLTATCFERLMQDPYANYVIQSALLVCKGHIRASLLDVIRLHADLRTNPYCKGIFNLLKK